MEWFMFREKKDSSDESSNNNYKRFKECDEIPEKKRKSDVLHEEIRDLKEKNEKENEDSNDKMTWKEIWDKIKKEVIRELEEEKMKEKGERKENPRETYFENEINFQPKPENAPMDKIRDVNEEDGIKSDEEDGIKSENEDSNDKMTWKEIWDKIKKEVIRELEEEKMKEKGERKENPRETYFENEINFQPKPENAPMDKIRDVNEEDGINDLKK
ncbi:MAG: hypothetical protein QXT40_00215 [Candidatus Micrarchaeia archaeon]